jgi:hypothetical protein
MIAEILNTFRINVDYLERLVDGIPEEKLTAQPDGLRNHPLWTLGHLAYSLEAMAGELGIEPWLPPGWSRPFGPGSQPVADRRAYPPREDLLQALLEGKQRLTEALSPLDDDELLRPLPDTRYRRRFPTIGHALLHILAAHLAVHVGQLGAWRRATGLPPVPDPGHSHGD